jgi:integrase
MRSALADCAGRSLFIKVRPLRIQKASGGVYKCHWPTDAGGCLGIVLEVSLTSLVWLHRSTGDHRCQDHLWHGLVIGTYYPGNGVKSAGVRSGNWLTRAQTQRLLDAPDVETLKGLRDRAILAALIGSGLRRSEAAALTFDKVTQREGRWVICDLKGKGNRTRTVPIPAWAKAAIDAWAEEAGIGDPSTSLRTGERVFRSVHKGGYVNGDRMSAQAIADVVREYAEKCGFDGLAAHDLRRTFAKLAHKGGAKLDQIQLSLGHASIKTTERYLGVEQDLQDAPCDRLGLRLRG